MNLASGHSVCCGGSRQRALDGPSDCDTTFCNNWLGLPRLQQASRCIFGSRMMQPWRNRYAYATYSLLIERAFTVRGEFVCATTEFGQGPGRCSCANRSQFVGFCRCRYVVPMVDGVEQTFFSLPGAGPGWSLGLYGRLIASGRLPLS